MDPDGDEDGDEEEPCEAVPTEDVPAEAGPAEAPFQYGPEGTLLDDEPPVDPLAVSMPETTSLLRRAQVQCLMDFKVCDASTLPHNLDACSELLNYCLAKIEAKKAKLGRLYMDRIVQLYMTPWAQHVDALFIFHLA